MKLRNPRRIKQLTALILLCTAGWFSYQQYEIASYRSYAEKVSGLDLGKAKYLQTEESWMFAGVAAYSIDVFQFPSFDDAVFSDMCRRMAQHAVAIGAEEIDAMRYAIHMPVIRTDWMPAAPLCGLRKNHSASGNTETAILGRDGKIYVEFTMG